MKHNRLAWSQKRQICPVLNWTRGGSRFEFDLSWASGARSDCPHLKMNLIVSYKIDRSFMFSPKNAQFLAKPLYYWNKLYRCHGTYMYTIGLWYHLQQMVISHHRSLVQLDPDSLYYRKGKCREVGDYRFLYHFSFSNVDDLQTSSLFWCRFIVVFIVFNAERL